MQVTGNLVFVAPSSGTFTEVSQVQPIQGRNRYAYSALVPSASGILSIIVAVQWSNDMDNWYTVSGSLTYPHFFYGAGAAANVVRCVHG